MKKLNRKGFTIVELVIVIAVIAILAAVLIPTFSSVISKANESAAFQKASSAYTLLNLDKAKTGLEEGKTYYIAVDEDGDEKADYVYECSKSDAVKASDVKAADLEKGEGGNYQEYPINDDEVKEDLAAGVKFYTLKAAS